MANSDPLESADIPASLEPIKGLLRARYIFPAVHAFLFLAMWVTFGVSTQGLAQGVPGFFFGLLFLMDLPFSIYAFGAMFTSDEYAHTALIAWALGGTLWWYLLGLGLDAWIRRRKAARLKKRGIA